MSGKLFFNRYNTQIYIQSPIKVTTVENDTAGTKWPTNDECLHQASK